MTSLEALPRKLQPSSTPIDILNNDTARLYTHLHPVLLLGVFFLRFNALVADPVHTLFTSLIPLGILQLCYVVLCLPSAGGSGSQPLPKPGKPGQRRKPAQPKAGLGTKIVPGILSLTLALFLAGPALLILLILFGAPFTTHFFHNFLCASHIAVLAVLPLVYVHGVDKSRWREIAAVFLPFDEVWGATVGTCLGAWLGAIPIPLDWDREWQKWPVTIITGAYLGYVVGKLVGGYLLRGKRIEFDEPGVE